MALAKNARTIVVSATNTAGGSTSGTLDLSTKYGLLINARVTNGGTGPTLGCAVTIQTSNDNSTWRQFAKALAGVDNSGVYDFPFLIPAEVMYVRVLFDGNTAQSVTVEATGQELTSL